MSQPSFHQRASKTVSQTGVASSIRSATLRTGRRALQRVVACGALLLLVGACSEGVRVSNQPGSPAFVGPNLAGEDGVTTFFGVTDAEGNIQRVAFEICRAGTDDCFVPEPLPGSTTLNAVPSIDASQSAALRVVWSPCGELDDVTEFEAQVVVLDSPDGALRSPVTSLQALGTSVEVLCD